MNKKSRFLAVVLMLSILVGCVFSSSDMIFAKSSNEIKLEKSKYGTYVGNKVNIKVDKISKYTFTSLNKKIATVNKKGVVTPRKKGTANIRVSIKNDSEKYVICKIKVYDNKNIYQLQKYVGKWEVDSEKTMDENGCSMWDMYGSAFTHYGAELEIKSNGKFCYYIGAGNGGAGKCKIKKANRIYYEIKTYEEGSNQSGTIVSQGKYLVMSDPDSPELKVYWIRKEEEQSKPRTNNNSDKKVELSQYLGKKISVLDKEFYFESTSGTDFLDVRQNEFVLFTARKEKGEGISQIILTGNPKYMLFGIYYGMKSNKTINKLNNSKKWKIYKKASNLLIYQDNNSKYFLDIYFENNMVNSITIHDKLYYCNSH